MGKNYEFKFPAGKEQFLLSEVIIVEISGKPQVLISRSDTSVWYPRETEANMVVAYCSDPKPRTVQWRWDNLILSQGKNIFISLNRWLKMGFRFCKHGLNSEKEHLN